MRRVVSERPAHHIDAGPVAAYDRREPLRAIVFPNHTTQLLHVGLVVGAGQHRRLHTLPLYGIRLDPDLLRQQAREELRDLRGGTIACHQRELRHLLALLRKHPADVREARRTTVDRLELIAEEHEVRVTEVACEQHELRLCVILHLIDDHVTGVAIGGAGQRHLEVAELRRCQIVLSEDRLTDGLHIEPVEVPDLLIDTTHLALIRLLVIEIVEALIVLLLFLLLRVAACELLELLHSGLDQPGRGRSPLMAAQHTENLLLIEHACTLQVDVMKVLRLDREAHQPLIDLVQRIRFCDIRLAEALHPEIIEEVGPGHGHRIRLAHLRQHVVDVLLEDRIQCDERDLIRTQCMPATVEQIRDALQQHGGLTGARDALHEQHRHVRIADDEVLLLLNRLRDGLHLIAPLLRERVDQQRILQRDFCVEVGLQHIALQVKLSAQL